MSRITTRRWVSFTLAVTMTLFALALPKPARAEVTTNLSVPLNMLVFIPCANGGAGEWVELTGNLHVLFSTTFDAKGGFHAKSHFQPQGVSGVGQDTGDKYQGTGVSQEHFNGKVGLTYTSVDNFRIIGQGPGNNFLVHATYHFTVNANGEVTAEVDNFSIDCK